VLQLQIVIMVLSALVVALPGSELVSTSPEAPAQDPGS
jgi:hypothetical protein